MSHSRGGQLTLTDTHAVFRSSAQSQPQIAVILGRDEKDGRERVFLDRTIAGTALLPDGWTDTGAVTTILTRRSS